MLKYVLIFFLCVGGYVLDLDNDCDGHYCGGRVQMIKKD